MVSMNLTAGIPLEHPDVLEGLLHHEGFFRSTNGECSQICFLTAAGLLVAAGFLAGAACPCSRQSCRQAKHCRPGGAKARSAKDGLPEYGLHLASFALCLECLMDIPKNPSEQHGSIWPPSWAPYPVIWAAQAFRILFVIDWNVDSARW